MRDNSTRLLPNIILLLIGVGGFCAPTAAETSATDWQFTAVLYAWFPELTGSATFPTGQPGNITIDPHDILSNLNHSFTGIFEARKGPWGGFTDIMYTDVSGSKSNSRDLSIRGQAIPAGVTADLHLDLKSTVWTLAGYYRTMDTPAVTLDLLFGARGQFLQQQLNWQFSSNFGSFVGPARDGSGSSDSTDWDGIVGVKGRWSFGEQRSWYVPYYFDIGTGASQLTWQGMLGLGYAFSWGSVIGTWRYLAYHYSSNSASLTQSGPAIGVAFRW